MRVISILLVTGTLNILASLPSWARNEYEQQRQQQGMEAIKRNLEHNNVMQLNATQDPLNYLNSQNQINAIQEVIDEDRFDSIIDDEEGDWE